MVIVGLSACSEFVPIEETCPVATACPEAGAAECLGTLRRVCIQVGPCLSWQDITCGDGRRCSQGVCGADDCATDGKTRCISPFSFETCAPGASGFLGWSGAAECEIGARCEDGQCKPGECDTAGLKTCVSGSSFQECLDSQGQLAWGETEGCPEGQVCAGGACGAHACTEVGMVQCTEDGTGRQVCKAADDGFRYLAEPIACDAGQSCFDGICGAHECKKGELSCVDGGLAECTDDGGFLIYGPPTACADGLECRQGACGADACPLEDVSCEDGMIVGCAKGPDGFLALVEPAVCVDGVCADGLCLPHECPIEKAVECSSEKTYRLCETAGSGQLVWSDNTLCPGSAVCKAKGVCGVDFCQFVGQSICDTATASKTCKDVGAGFLNWAEPVECDMEDVCKAGQCGADACIPGEGACAGDAALQLCEQDASGFWVFGASGPCPDETECQGGVCLPLGEVVLSESSALGKPLTTALSNGHAAAVWAAAESGSFPVFLRYFDAAGAPLAAAVNVSGPVGNTLPYPSVAAFPQAGPDAVAVVWFNSSATGSLNVVRVNKPGELPQPAVLIPPGGLFPADPQPVLAQLTPGLMEVVRIEGFGDSQSVVGTFTDGLSSVGEPTTISQATQPITGLAAAATVGGGLWAVWTVTPNADVDPVGIVIRRVPPDGAPKQSPMGVFAGAAAASRPAVAMATDSRGLVAWDQATPAGGKAIWAQRIAANGLLEGDPLVVHEEGDSPHLGAAVAPLGTGWVVVWEGPDEDSSGVLARRLGADGQPVSAVFPVSADETGPQQTPTAAALTDGRVIIIWRDGLGASASIRGRYLAP